MKFTKQRLKDIPVEDAHGGSGKRQMLLSPSYVTSKHWEVVTKGFLGKGEVFDWHEHPDADELFIVLKGSGKFSCSDGVVDYGVDDVIITSAGFRHKIEANEDSEFYFVRVKM